MLTRLTLTAEAWGTPAGQLAGLSPKAQSAQPIQSQTAALHTRPGAALCHAPMVERVYSRLKDEFGARFIRVRGAGKIMAHLMFGVLALTVDQLLKLTGQNFGFFLKPERADSGAAAACALSASAFQRCSTPRQSHPMTANIALSRSFRAHFP